MNERIQELAYEAEDYADSIVDQGGEFHPAYTKKFAELIVRECIETFMGVPPSYKDYRSQIEEAMRDYCVSVVKQHFGINE